MKILFAVNNDLTKNRGSTVHILEIVKNLEGLGHEVFLFSYKKPQSDEGLRRGGFSFPLPKVRFVRGLWFYFASFFFLMYLMARYRPDIVYTRLHPRYVIPALIARITKRPLVVEVNGFLQGELAITGAGKAQIASAVVVEQKIYKLATSVIVVTEGLRNAILKAYRLPQEKIAVIPNGVNIDFFKPIPVALAKDRLNLKKDLNYILLVGYLAKWQDLNTVIECMSIIRNECPEAHLLVVGDGPEKCGLIERVRLLNLNNYVSFIGEVPREIVPTYINAAEVCLVPSTRSLNEEIGRSPIKLYAYMACERPVVASDVAGVGHFLRQSGAGNVVEPEDHVELAQAILELLRDEKLRERMGRIGRETVREDYDWKNIARKVENVLISSLRYVDVD